METNTKPSTADLLALLAESEFDLGQDQDHEPFAVPKNTGIARQFRGDSSFRALLANRYRATSGKVASTSAVAAALLALEGRALAAPVRDVYLRTAPLSKGGGILLDLGDDSGQVIEIQPGHWQVRPWQAGDPLFYRTTRTKPLPFPPTQASGLGSLDPLKAFLDLDADSWALALGWLLHAFEPTTPKSILLLRGEQGSGKSTRGRALKALLDPGDLSKPTNNSGDWEAKAKGSYLVGMDNVNHIGEDLADALCRTATGAVVGGRKLFTDSDTAEFRLLRPVMLNGIAPSGLTPDLTSRLVSIEVPKLNGDPQPESDIWPAFNNELPTVLAGLLNVLAEVLAVLPEVSRTGLTRMADFGLYLRALDSVLPGLNAEASYYRDQQTLAVDVASGDEVAEAVLRFTAGRPTWEGTASELLGLLNTARNYNNESSSKTWPSQPHHLTRRLNKLSVPLRAMGVAYEQTRTDSARILRLSQTDPAAIPPSTEVIVYDLAVSRSAEVGR